MSLALLNLHDLWRDLMLYWTQYFADLLVVLLCLYFWRRLRLLIVCVIVLTVNVFLITVRALYILLYWANFRFNNEMLFPEVVSHIHWLNFQNVTHSLVLRTLFVFFLFPFFKRFKGKFLNMRIWILGLIACYSYRLQCFLFLFCFWLLRRNQSILVFN